MDPARRKKAIKWATGVLRFTCDVCGKRWFLNILDQFWVTVLRCPDCCKRTSHKADTPIEDLDPATVADIRRKTQDRIKRKYLVLDDRTVYQKLSTLENPIDFVEEEAKYRAKYRCR